MMKRRIKGLFTLFLTVAAIMLTAFALTSAASAAEKISCKVTYDESGAATLRATPSKEENYITFTYNGSKPTADSELFPETFIVRGGTFSARLAEYDINGECVSRIKIEVTPKAARVKINREYEAGETKVTLSCATEGAKIYYTLDGSVPTKESEEYTGTPITLKEAAYIRAAAFKSGLQRSSIVGKKITVKENIIASENETEISGGESSSTKEKVKYSVAYNAETAVTYITLSPRNSDNKIYYTTDGSAPTRKSTLYSKRIKFKELCTLRAVEYSPSGKLVASLKYKVKLRCGRVEFTNVDVAEGTVMVKMTSQTEGADIYYTVNGKTPTTKSMKYTGPVMIGMTTRLKAIAVKSGYEDSIVESEKGSNILPDISDFNYDDRIFTDFLDKINYRRVAKGFDEFELNEKISRVAQMRARELKSKYSDTRPNGSGWSSVLAAEGIYYTRGFEVIDKNVSADTVIDQVMKAPYIEEYKYRYIGIGYYESDGECFWTVIIAHY